MKMKLALLLIFAVVTPAIAGPREDSLSYNSTCIIAHADRYGYYPSTGQKQELAASSQDPKKVLALLKSYVKESIASYDEGIKMGPNHPKFKSIKPADRNYLIKTFRDDKAKCVKLLKELNQITDPGIYLPGVHSIKGKENPCPHDADGKLEVAKFNKLR